MKLIFSTISLLALASLSTAAKVNGKPCTPGEEYCGYDLWRTGGYGAYFNAELRANGLGAKDDDVHWTVFECVEDSDIKFITHCGNHKCKPWKKSEYELGGHCTGSS
ncbi:hypothetical protein BDV25DRAFT_139913 [Aspergillus avenaceus]|uniref:Uncharacterized protein n=1 Tax=Aspergillus avenaceus TaxID=36643 RepID=A0A5N6TVE4_ASPAV|nr:hypothetical protein BDV25DRAFT_139913 [Aspergillus avenaceus]